tara:strand:+ start:1289 stop:1786 length:498 start_codon:yes stop_codon:yes gene_type:complete
MKKESLKEIKLRYSEFVLELLNKLQKKDDEITKLKAKTQEIEYLKDKLTRFKNLPLDYSWVAIWEESEIYGGAEEGGWYFNHDKLIGLPFRIPDDLITVAKKWFAKEYGNTQMKNVVMSDEAYHREIEIYGDLLDPLRGEITASGKYKLSFHKEYPAELPYPSYS